MICRFSLSLVLFLAAASLAQAAGQSDVPTFFAGDQRFVPSADQCGEPEFSDREDLRVITRAGIRAYEFGCTFQEFRPVHDMIDHQVFGWVAEAVCGDDSGIKRPDSFFLSLNADEVSLHIQSQNEYSVGDTLALLADRAPEILSEHPDLFRAPFEAANFISGDYVACDAEGTQ